MPAGISSLPPSFDYDPKKAPAFAVIPRDNMESTLPLLHINYMNGDHNGNDFIKGKNERNNFYSRRRISRSNDHLVLANLQAHQVNPRPKQSRSHDRLTGNDNTSEDNKPAINLSTENFSEILAAKLKKISSNHEIKAGKRQKKPFITTVKTGEFLMPPPEVAALLGMTPNGSFIGHDADDAPPRSKFRPVSIGRRPEVRHNSHNARCQAALKATVDFAVNIVHSSAATASTLASEAGAKRGCSKGFADETDQLPYGNIMFDRRVVRGSTFASAPAFADGDHSTRLTETRRRQKRRCQAQNSRSSLRITSPPPVPGRRHEPVQTDVYLEELLEKPQESEVATQTDYFLEKPATPPFCPKKLGVDAETQIGPGDLFDYDAEVQPILEVLVGKTIEQALIEVLEEEELAVLKEQQRRFLELRAAEKAEEQRLEEQERRLREEKERRLRQEEEALKAQLETEERVAAAVLLTGYVAEVLPSVLDQLKMSGLLLDEIKSDVEEGFVPWLVKEVKREMTSVLDSRELLADIIKEILEKRAHGQFDEDYQVQSPLAPAEDEDETDIEENFNTYQQLIENSKFSSRHRKTSIARW